MTASSETHAAAHPRVHALGLAAALGVAVFVVSWAGNSRTEEGNASYLGLEEGDWRALLNPVFAVWIVWFWRTRERAGRVGEIGAWLAGAGLVAILVGNLLEFGPLGEPFLPEDPPGSGSWSWGWAPMLVAAPVTLAGAVVLAIAYAWRRVAG